MMEISKKYSGQYIIGHFSWSARIRFISGIAISLVLFMSLGMNVLKPWDPFGAISLLLVNNTLALIVRLIGILIAVGILSTIIISARLPFFGVFSAAVGMAWPISQTAGMDYLMVRLQVGKEFENSQVLWAYLAFETILWATVLLVLIIAILFIEDWLNKTPVSNNNINEKNNDEITSRLTIKTIFAKDKIFNGIISVISTAIFGVIFIALFAASQSKGQIIFATFAGMFLAAMISEQITPTNHPVWQTLSVILVALIAYGYSWFNPRPPGLEAVLHIAPNNLARVLPIEYVFIGSAGAIMGVWYSYRFRYSKDFE